MDYDAPAGIESIEAFLGEELILVCRPVVENHRVEVKIGRRERILPHVADLRPDTRLQSIIRHDIRGHFTYRRSIKNDRAQLWPSSDRADRMRTRAPGYIEHDPMLRQIDFVGPSARRSHARAVHHTRELA